MCRNSASATRARGSEQHALLGRAVWRRDERWPSPARRPRALSSWWQLAPRPFGSVAAHHQPSTGGQLRRLVGTRALTRAEVRVGEEVVRHTRLCGRHGQALLEVADPLGHPILVRVRGRVKVRLRVRVRVRRLAPPRARPSMRRVIAPRRQRSPRPPTRRAAASGKHRPRAAEAGEA